METNNESQAIVDCDPHTLRKETAAFLALAAVLSVGVSSAMLARVLDGIPRGDADAIEQALGGLTMVYGFAPFVAAVVVTAVFRRRQGLAGLFRRVTTWRVSPIWYLAALTVPLMPQWLGLLGWAWFSDADLSLPPTGTYLSSWFQIALISAVYFIGEELGWRGFLLPRLLAHRQWLTAAVSVGLIWAVWHYPYWIISGWAMNEHWLDIALSTMVSSGRAVALSILITWIFRQSRGSVLIAMLFHGSNNANFNKMFDAAGPDALIGPTFLAVQAIAVAVIALCVVAMTRMRKSGHVLQ
jgi:membrane protease YdiL (CAAX protease family)